MSAKNQDDTNKNNPADDYPNEDDQSEAQPFVTHLIELRSRLLKGLCAILIAFLCLFYFANDIYSLVAAPLIEQLAPGSTMIATEVASPFMAPFKLTLFAAIFITMPYLLAQLWGFIAPGLYQQEQHLARPLLISSILLFYAGTAFAYFVVFPLIFGFFNAVAPDGVAVMTDISRYLDFVLK
ncbi:MAG: twin-arginine translocase subunit TatC, partial [Gammaproteobacteria bacterium]|nr:twin-arginine translocase subunit TatC [Gammaproteobacteria bacterium]